MVIGAKGVACDAGCLWLLLLCWKIVVGEGDDGACAWYKAGGIGAEVEVALHVVHVAVVSFAEPLLEAASIVGEGLGTGEADGCEAEAEGFGTDELCGVLWGHDVKLRYGLGMRIMVVFCAVFVFCVFGVSG